MAIEFYGFSGAGKKLNTAWWARFDALASLGKHVVGSGGVVTSGGATRLLSVSAYEAKVPGVIVADSAVSSVAAAANGGGSTGSTMLRSSQTGDRRRWRSRCCPAARRCRP